MWQLFANSLHTIIFGLEGQVPEALYHGGIADISEYIQFDWYQYVWYMNPGSKKQLGQWVGVAKDVGRLMTFWILLKSGIVVPRSSVTMLTPEEMGTDGIKAMMKELDDGIRQKIGDQLKDDELLPGIEDLPGIDDSPWDIKDDVFDLLSQKHQPQRQMNMKIQSFLTSTLVQRSI